jgi:hypothetical protein
MQRLAVINTTSPPTDAVRKNSEVLLASDNRYKPSMVVKLQDVKGTRIFRIR